MTTTLTAPGRTTTPRPGFAHAMAFEWIKIKSLRSTWWTLGACAALTIGLGMFSASMEDGKLGLTGTVQSLYGAFPLGSVAMCVLGVLAATSEYGTGTIRTTFTAVPDRIRLLNAKTLVVFALCLTAGTVISFTTYLAGTAMLPAGIAYPSLTDGSMLRGILGGGIYLGVLGVLALALGLVLRASAGGITAAVTVVFILPAIFPALGESAAVTLFKWWPTEAGQNVLLLTGSPDGLSPLTGLLYFTAVALACLASAAAWARQRDV
jgi:ABC-2 type transport system permease protein